MIMQRVNLPEMKFHSNPLALYKKPVKLFNKMSIVIDPKFLLKGPDVPSNNERKDHSMDVVNGVKVKTIDKAEVTVDALDEEVIENSSKKNCC